ncbi:hypothetical protein EPN18_02570 [bacterium]|nr:MAG: hypothetical protein EPN18_02570 [bacterium]
MSIIKFNLSLGIERKRGWAGIFGYIGFFYTLIFRHNNKTKMDLKQNIKFWLPVILWMGFIFWMSTGIGSAQNTSLIIEPVLRFLVPGISPQELDMAHEVIRKCAHIFEYFILGFLLFRAFRRNSTEIRGWRWAFYSMIIVLIYAGSDECHQAFVSNRTPAIFDVGVDLIGGLLAQAERVIRLYSDGRIKNA